MLIYHKNKHLLQFDDFYFKCCIGKNGSSKNKLEGDKKTPQGIFNIGNLYYRKDRIKNFSSKVKRMVIKKNMGWSDDVRSKKYNKLIKIKNRNNPRHEKLYRKDCKYDLLIPIMYNFKKPKPKLGSCIFFHITKNYQPTAGCIALKKTDFLIMLKLINKKTKVIIN